MTAGFAGVLRQLQVCQKSTLCKSMSKCQEMLQLCQSHSQSEDVPCKLTNSSAIKVVHFYLETMLSSNINVPHLRKKWKMQCNKKVRNDKQQDGLLPPDCIPSSNSVKGAFSKDGNIFFRNYSFFIYLLISPNSKLKCFQFLPENLTI